jgi:hypothetical protein
MTETELEHPLLRHFDDSLKSLAETRPRAYLLATALLAVVGCLWLLMFPWLVLAGISGAYEAVTGAPAVAWIPLLLWIAVTAGAALVTYRMVRFRPAPPAGVVLDRKNTPALFVLVNELRQQYRAPWIDRVMISGEFELEIVKTPCCGLPLWSTCTLVIGLPLAQSLSPAQFRCELARRLGQISQRHNRIVSWLARLRRIWPLYAPGASSAEPGFQAVGWFFKVFAPLYSRVSLPAARLDELAADSCAMETCTDEEVLDTITTEAVCRLFITEKYWPTYRKLTERMRDVLPKPHAGMAAVLRTGLHGEKYQEWLTAAMTREPRPDEAVPSLSQRVDNIGYRNPCMRGMAAEAAATVYFGPVGNELDAALERASQSPSAPVKAVDSLRFQPVALISSMMHRLGHRSPNAKAPVGHEHGQLTTLH